MIRAEDIKDDFWNVAARESVEDRKLREEIATLNAQLDVARRCEALKHAPGYQDFLKSLQSLHSAYRAALIGDDRLTNDGLREMRGKVKGVESVLALLTSTTETSALAKRLQDCQNQLNETLKRRPQPKEVTP